MKVCPRCNKTQDLSMFCTDTKRKDGKGIYCKSCVNLYTKTLNLTKQRQQKLKESRNSWKQANPDKIRKDWIKRVYGLLWEDYKLIFASQGGICAICGTPLKLHKGVEHGEEVAIVDHDHKTGKVRGLLCNLCNKGLGHFKDSKELLTKALNYIEDKGIK